MWLRVYDWMHSGTLHACAIIISYRTEGKNSLPHSPFASIGQEKPLTLMQVVMATPLRAYELGSGLAQHLPELTGAKHSQHFANCKLNNGD